MSETVIGLFPDNHEAQEFVPMLTNRGTTSKSSADRDGRPAKPGGT
jgi:hypothetical protein